MPVVTVTLTPTAITSLGGRWCVVGETIEWKDSGDSVTLDAGTYTIQYGYVEGYQTPADAAITVAAVDQSVTGAYGADSWPSTWKPPISACLFNGQVLTGGCIEDTASARLVRWSEIGALRFLGATANRLRNEAGFMYTSHTHDEVVMRVLPIGERAVIVYTTNQIIALNPVSQPAPTFSVQTLSRVGILNPLAVDAGEREHLLVNAQGDLCRVYIGARAELLHENLGYSEFFSSLQSTISFTTGAGMIVVTYNPDQKEYYIGTSAKGFLFKGGLTEVKESYTSYINIVKTPLEGAGETLFTAAPLSSITETSAGNYTYLETDILDFGISGKKQIQSVTVHGSFSTGQTVEVMVKWRNARTGSFSDTTWKRCSPDGFVAPIVAGSDLKICLRVSSQTSVVINGLTVEWQLSDKHSTRGNYTNVNSITSGSDQ